MADGDTPQRRAGDSAPDMHEFLDFLREVCRVLMECGCSSNRVEQLTVALGASWGFEVETLAIPTGVWISVRKDRANMIELTRVKSWSVDLDRLSRMNDLVEQIGDRRVSIADACERMRALTQAKAPYGLAPTLAAGGIASGVLVYSYGGPAPEVALAVPIGAFVQLLTKYLLVGENRRYLGDFLSAALVATYVSVLHTVLPEIDVARMIVGGLVLMVPGLTTLNAVHEVAQKNLVSGAAKLLEALVITASLGMGVVFVLGFASLFGSAP